ncbi:MAG: segregation/condensation protein A [Lachnospiraceae bacterium]|jgi:segregation and condensation protein A|nr:segregation/condensation protein A [Lachnospiraceae bacterium]
MELKFKLEAFEGPLDLLLHLIDVNKINIYDIPIAEITDQYLEAIKGIEELNLDTMSEFLLMASTLLKIKSKMLLPKEIDEETGEEIDPRTELVERLLEYKVYKYTSLELKDMAIDADRVFFKKSNLPPEVLNYHEEVPVSELLNDLTLNKLNLIFESVMKKREDKIDPVRSKFGKIAKEEITLSAKMRHVQAYGLLNRKFSFRGLLESRTDKMDIIVTFLCILELMKMGRMTITQKDIFEDIEIEYTADDIIDFDEKTIGF